MINEDYPKGHKYVIHGVLDFACGDRRWLTRHAIEFASRQSLRYCLKHGMTRRADYAGRFHKTALGKVD